MKGKVMKEEVKAAVNEYLDRLITERSRPGQGHSMAVSAHDLMVAANSVGQRTSRTEADELLDKLLSPTLYVVKPETPSVRIDGSRISNSRSKSVPVPNLQVEGIQACGQSITKRPSRKDYHWLVWKTTPTPAPSEPHGPSPCPEPRPPSVRPVSSRARSVRSITPACTPLPDRPASPDPFRSPSIHPELRPEARSPPTPYPGPQRILTPAPTYEDEQYRSPVIPQAPAPRPGTSQYVPALKAWVSNADDQEKEVAYNLFKALNAGMNPLKIPKVKARPRAATASPKPQPPGPTKLYKMPVAGVKTSMPGNKAYMDKNIEEQYLRLVSRSLQNAEPPTYTYTGQNNTSRPWPTHMERPQDPIDYTNENAFFMNANQPYRSHFTIHPEWVSETKAGSRDLKLLMCTKGPNGIRYMAQKK